MRPITLARTRPDGSVVESFTAADRVDCTTLDGTEDSYEIDPGESLGCGGNAIVYGCRNIGSGEPFAIKIQTNTQSERLCRFKREEQLLCSVRHEQLMSCVGFGEIVMTKHREKRGYCRISACANFLTRTKMNLTLQWIMRKSVLCGGCPRNR